MKTSEQWFNESDTHWGDGRCSMTRTTIEAIQQDAHSDDAGLVDEMAKVLNLLPTKDQCCVCLVGEFCAPCLVNRTLAKYAALQSARKEGGE